MTFPLGKILCNSLEYLILDPMHSQWYYILSLTPIIIINQKKLHILIWCSQKEEATRITDISKNWFDQKQIWNIPLVVHHCLGPRQKCWKSKLGGLAPHSLEILWESWLQGHCLWLNMLAWQEETCKNDWWMVINWSWFEILGINH